MADWKKLLDDAVGTIGEGVQAAGEGLRGLADDARKVAGIGRGSVEIVPDRARHRLGGTIAGTVKLALTEPVAARRLVVAVRARRKPNTLGRIAGRARESAPREETVFDFESTVAGEQIYERGEFRFEIDLPDALDPSIDAGGLLGDALRAARSVQSLTHGQLRWTLVAFLDIPWKRNLSTSIEIAVREAVDLDDDDDQPEPAAPPRRSEPEPPKRDAAPPEHEARAESSSSPRDAGSRPRPDTAPSSRRNAGSPPRSEPSPSPSPSPPSREPPSREPPSTSAADAPVSRPPPVAPTPANEFLGALDRCLATLGRRGFAVIHEHRPPPVDPASVMQALARHPDLDAELLQFYAVMDGLELAVAQPRIAAPRYDTADAAQTVAARSSGALGSLDALALHAEIGPALFREFCDDTLRVLEIPPLHRLLDATDRFPKRDGRSVVFGAIVLRHGDAFGLVHADQIRSWRPPRAGRPTDDFDVHAEAWHACLRERESTHACRWWAIRTRDLARPELLRWPEMLTLCLQHLEHGHAGP